MRNKKFPDIYHIGCMKTGTTTLQKILKQDKRLNVIIYSRYFNTNRWYTDNYDYCKDGLVNIESDENIVRCYDGMYGIPVSLERIKKVSPNAHIVLTIREQRSLLLSGYKHHISKTNDSYSFLDFLNSNAGVTYISMCNFYGLYQTILRYFNNSNIHIFLFEELKDNFTVFFERFYQEVLELPKPETLEKIIENKSSSDQYLQIKRKLNSLYIFNPNSFFFKLERKAHYFLLKILPKLIRSHSKLTWGDSLLERKLEFEFKKSNQLLVQETGLDLERYGYLL